MTPKEKALELYQRFLAVHIPKREAISCALIAVKEIITANPHSNPFNTEPVSTMKWWQEVLEELKKL